MMADGSFAANLPRSRLPGAVGRSQPLHEVTGTISGVVAGNSISGTESMIYAVPCPGTVIQVKFTGSK